MVFGLGPVWKGLAQVEVAFLLADDHEVGVFLAQQGQAIAMEGAHEEGPGCLANLPVQTLLHLAGCPIGEGDGHHLFGFGMFRLQEMFDPGHQGKGLAGARPGSNEDGLSPAGDDGKLLRVGLSLGWGYPGGRRGLFFKGQRGAALFFCGRDRLFSGKQADLAGQLLPFSFGKDPDHPEFAIVTRGADDPARADPGHRLAQHRGEEVDLLHRGVEQQVELGAEAGNDLCVQGHHPLGGRAGAENLAQHLGQRDKAVHRGRAGRVVRLCPFGQLHDPVQHPHGQGLAADRADCPDLSGFDGLKADQAVPVAVGMVFPFFRVEFYRGGKGVGQGIFQGLAQSGKIEAGVEDIGLPAQFPGRMAIGVGDQGEAVQGRDKPVHVRVRGEPGFESKDVGAEISVAFLDGVKAGAGAEQGEPRGPDVGRNQESFRRFFQQDFEQVTGVETQDGAAVGLDVADPGQDAVDPFRRGEIRHIEQVVNLAHRAVSFVNGADLGGEQEAAGQGSRGYLRQGRGDHLILELVKPRLGRDELLLELAEPAGMGEVAGTEEMDALDPGPGGKSLQVAGLAGRPGEGGMDVKISDIAHYLEAVQKRGKPP